MSKDTAITTVVEIPVDAIDVDPDNPTRPVDTEFLASIREHGVRQPVIVRPNPDDAGRFRLVAGERRVTASRRAGRTHVPGIVRDLSDEEAVQEQLIENIHRADLAPCQEAFEMLRLVDLGMTQKQLAKRTGRSSKYVTERLRLLELPKGAQRLVDDGTFSVDAGLALTGLLDHPDHLGEIVKEQPHNVVATVRNTLHEIDRQSKVERLVAKAEAGGEAVVPWEGYRPTTYREIGRDGIVVDAKAHAGEPCHAVVIAPHGKPEAVAVCTEPKRHKARGTSPVKATGAEQADAHRADQRAERKARKEATEHRCEFVASLLSGRFRRTEALGVVLRSYIEDVPWNDAPKVAKSLGLDPIQGRHGEDWRGTLDAYTETSEVNLVRACLAVAVLKAEAGIVSGGHRDRVERFRGWLVGEGYQPTPYELDNLGWRPKQAKRKASKKKAASKAA